ncbi:MAG: sulfur carrier protein ThiS [Myxococcaceae bacterium]
MQVVVNGERREAPEGTTVLKLLQMLGIRGRVAVERNGTILRQAEHAETRLAEGDVLEVVTFVGGGA